MVVQLPNTRAKQLHQRLAWELDVLVSTSNYWIHSHLPLDLSDKVLQNEDIIAPSQKFDSDINQWSTSIPLISLLICPLTLTLVILETVSVWTNTSVGPIQVLTGAWAHFWDLETFIDIYQRKREKKERVSHWHDFPPSSN